MLAAHIEGFVDLEDHTPADQKNVLADHGMVVLFQPFTGNWTRILGVFASKGNVKSVTLAKTIVETAVLAEKAGLFVDCITCDGASWNRSMWRLLGIQESLAPPPDLALECHSRPSVRFRLPVEAGGPVTPSFGRRVEPG
ncbi:hypothetical protein HPB49_026495 [Dermacentor silvarum]|nr:hypothetical protein HPB49_026495 [Dermacentor silvarum]